MPDIAQAIGMPSPVFGGWMSSLASSIVKEGYIKLGIATIYKGKELIHKEINNVDYYLLPSKYHNKKYEKRLEYYWKLIEENFNPSIVHLHGSEYYHSLSFIRSKPQAKIVLSIQGLVSECANYYMGGLTIKELLKSLSIKELLLRTSLFDNYNRMKKRGKSEIEIIRSVKHVIGRTRWDYYHVKVINPNIKYHFCNETLRPTFYKNKWNYKRCTPHRIFLSQAGYPLKGLHQVIKAIPLVLAKYPDTELYIAGNNILKANSLREYIKTSEYSRYLRKLIKRYKLNEKIHFTGVLDEKDMCEAYLQSNIFISPSSIENSSNSLCEAQLLGMPCIASYVGGTADIMRGQEEWLYRFEDYELLSELICKAFKITEPIDSNQAMERHDAKLNYNAIISIYKSILEKNY